MDNCVQQKRWKKALGLAILLDKPFRCYQIIKQILQQEDGSEYSLGGKGREDLQSTLLLMRHDQISNIF